MQEQWKTGNGTVGAVSMGPAALQQTLMTLDHVNVTFIMKIGLDLHQQSLILSDGAVIERTETTESTLAEFCILIGHKVD